MIRKRKTSELKTSRTTTQMNTWEKFLGNKQVETTAIPVYTMERRKR